MRTTGWTVLLGLLAAGLGHAAPISALIIDGQNNLRPDLMLVSILTLALLGKSADSLLRLLEGKLLGWSDTFGERR